MFHAHAPVPAHSSCNAGVGSSTCLRANAQQTKITIGKVIGGNGLHIPTYVAMDKGFFKAEGLDATLVA